LLDNLHVAPDVRGGGVGRLLLGTVAREVRAREWHRGLHLWVFEANTGARRFYERHGASVVRVAPIETSDGSTNSGVCYAWTDSSVLLTPPLS
jgi:GNAT superfamily N-acetyltransferase